jgi:hypothetical protein
MSLDSIDMSKFRYIIIIRLEDGAAVATIPYADMIVDPELIAGFISAVVIFAKTPIRTIRKSAYDVLIKVGETMLVVLVADPVPDESPYRNRLRTVLGVIESGIDFRIPRFLKLPEYHWMHHLILKNLLTRIGYDWIGLLDGNIKQLNQTMTDLIDSQVNFGESIQELLISELCNQIDDGSPTINLDIQKMIEHGELAKRVSQVIELRCSEMNDLVLYQEGNMVDLEPVWMTAYGFQILRSMNVKRQCIIENFDEIKREFGRLGFLLKITTNKQEVRQLRATEELVHYVRVCSESEMVVDFIRRIGKKKNLNS